jgi:uncharacterized protein (DUF4415 family)
MKMVRYKKSDLPPITKKRKAELEALAKKPDHEIDYSDIPPLDDGFWKDSVRGLFYKPKKTQASIRIDSDVLAWLKSQGKGYQPRMNAILRAAMLNDLNARTGGSDSLEGFHQAPHKTKKKPKNNKIKKAS